MCSKSFKQAEINPHLDKCLGAPDDDMDDGDDEFLLSASIELENSGYGVGQLSSSLTHAVPNAISVFFNPAAGDASVDAAIQDVVLKMGRKAELLKSHAIGTERTIAGQSSKARRAWKMGNATVALGVGVGLDQPGLNVDAPLSSAAGPSSAV